jgi:hypothetical protein
MNSIEKRSDRTDVHARMTAAIERAYESDFQKVGFLSDSEKSPAAHPTTLNEIQIRACRIHQEHGAVYGGYTLDDWLEAEHELDDELRGSHEKTEQVQ